MPVFTERYGTFCPSYSDDGNNSKPIPFYCHPMIYVENWGDGKIVDEWRRMYMTEYESLKALQKTLSGEKDFDGARIISDLSKKQMKLYRASCLIIPHTGFYPFPGDCKEMPITRFPIDLSNELDELLNRLELNL